MKDQALQDKFIINMNEKNEWYLNSMIFCNKILHQNIEAKLKFRVLLFFSL